MPSVILSRNGQTSGYQGVPPGADLTVTGVLNAGSASPHATKLKPISTRKEGSRGSGFAVPVSSDNHEPLGEAFRSASPSRSGIATVQKGAGTAAEVSERP